MPNYGSLINQLLGNSGVLQYPDKKLYKAALKLLPEERPKVPVRALDPQSDIFGGKKIAAAWNGPVKEISVNNKSPEYGDNSLLAAVMAHEAEHERRSGQPDFRVEGPAYQRQLDVLKRLNYSDVDYRRALNEQVRRATEEDKKLK